MPRPSELTPAQVVEAWQTSETLKQFYAHFPGHSRNVLRGRIRYYRQRGVPLKHLAGERIDWDKLSEWALQVESPPGGYPNE